MLVFYVTVGGTKETELIKYLFLRNGTTKVIKVSNVLVSLLSKQRHFLFYFMHKSPGEF